MVSKTFASGIISNVFGWPACVLGIVCVASSSWIVTDEANRQNVHAALGLFLSCSEYGCHEIEPAKILHPSALMAIQGFTIVGIIVAFFGNPIVIYSAVNNKKEMLKVGAILLLLSGFCILIGPAVFTGVDIFDLGNKGFYGFSYFFSWLASILTFISSCFGWLAAFKVHPAYLYK